MLRHLSLYMASVLGMLFCALPAWSASPPGEEQLKSAIIINLARYVDWPADAFTSAQAPFVACTLGRSRLSTALDELRDTTVKGHPVTVRTISGADDLSGCHLVVALTDDRHRVSHLIDKSRRLPVLTIGELPGFSRNGGMVELFLVENRIRFKINLGAARTSRLSISTHLLKLAHDVIK